MEKVFRVGVFASPHGIKGEFKVFPTGDDPSRFKKYKELILDNGKDKHTEQVESVRFFKNMVILKLKGIDTPEDALKLKGYELYVTRKDAIPLKKGEYYISDLIGLNVYDDEGEKLGTLTDVLQTGANDVYVVDLGEKELLLPAIKDCILRVDLEEEKMIVHVLDGLMDL